MIDFWTWGKCFTTTLRYNIGILLSSRKGISSSCRQEVCGPNAVAARSRMQQANTTLVKSFHSDCSSTDIDG